MTLLLCTCSMIYNVLVWYFVPMCAFIVRLLVTDPKLCAAVYNGMYTSHQYRLVGPGAWSGARQATLEIIERLQYPVNAAAVNDKVQTCADSRRRRRLLTASVAAIVAACVATLVAKCANGKSFWGGARMKSAHRNAVLWLLLND